MRLSTFVLCEECMTKACPEANNSVCMYRAVGAVRCFLFTDPNALTSQSVKVNYTGVIVCDGAQHIVAVARADAKMVAWPSLLRSCKVPTMLYRIEGYLEEVALARIRSFCAGDYVHR